MKCLLLFFVWLIALPLQAESLRQISIAQPTIVNPQTDCAVKTLNAAYAKLGYQVNYALVPAKRALIMSNSGILDGETARIEGIEQTYPNLQRIPIPICKLQVWVFSLKQNRNELTFNTLNQLKHHRVGGLRGQLFTEKYLSAYLSYQSTSNRQLVQMLMSHRLDFIILSKSGFKNSTLPEEKPMIYRHHIELPSVYLFHYLHKKHQKLIMQITKILQQMQADGFIEDAIKNHK